MEEIGCLQKGCNGKATVCLDCVDKYKTNKQQVIFEIGSVAYELKGYLSVRCPHAEKYADRIIELLNDVPGRTQ